VGGFYEREKSEEDHRGVLVGKGRGGGLSGKGKKIEVFGSGKKPKGKELGRGGIYVVNRGEQGGPNKKLMTLILHERQVWRKKAT